MIPNMGGLLSFEAAARLQSFTQAARELGVSQAAVSYSIRQLEDTLGVRLFLRRHKQIFLTEAGEKFLSDVSIGLAHIRRSAEAIQRPEQDKHVTLSVSTAFAHYWMVPRLSMFREKHPHIDLRMQTTDRDIDIAEESVSLGVRRGDGNWDGYNSFLLAREKIYPVCSPMLLRQSKPPTSPAELQSRSLIHLEEPFRPRPKWSNWFAAYGVDYRDSGLGLRLNDYALVIQAAIAGEGIALGWHHLVDLLIEKKVLVEALPRTYAWGAGFYVIWSKTSELTAEAEQVLQWLKSQRQETAAATDVPRTRRSPREDLNALVAA
jgi:DNA-binding transcriptional LysR family regulator